MIEKTHWFGIVNPVSGSGKGKSLWEKASYELKKNNFIFDYKLTSQNFGAKELVEQAVLSGYRNFVCVGGDGTIHNLVNGIMSQKTTKHDEIKTVIIPSGTANDWCKHHKISNNIKSFIDRVINQKCYKQDIGVIKISGGVLKVKYFMNYAGVGFDGFVISKIKKYKKFGRLSYLIAVASNFLNFINFNSIVSFDDTKLKSTTFLIGVGLCSYTGGGMVLVKDPVDNDGLFDLTIAKNLSKFDVLQNITNLFNKKLFSHPKVETIKTAKLTISLEKSNSLAQADGELIVGGKFKFSIAKTAFKICL